jgi:hypothetical protein
LSIKQGIDKIWTTSSGAQWGFYFSPLAFIEIGNILTFHREYFTQYSKQVMETIELNSEYSLSPGDYTQIYEQRTRHVSAFDAYKIRVCGESELIKEEYMLQWWAIAYHAVSVNPFSDENIPLETIGIYPKNTCGEMYSDDFSKTDQHFVRTN